MTLINSLQTQVDTPVWEWCRFTPAVSAATMTTCTSGVLGARYIYLMSVAAFYRYDTYTDSYQTLQMAPTVPATAVTMNFQRYSGYRGRV